MKKHVLPRLDNPRTRGNESSEIKFNFVGLLSWAYEDPDRPSPMLNTVGFFFCVAMVVVVLAPAPLPPIPPLLAVDVVIVVVVAVREVVFFASTATTSMAC